MCAQMGLRRGHLGQSSACAVDMTITFVSQMLTAPSVAVKAAEPLALELRFGPGQSARPVPGRVMDSTRCQPDTGLARGPVATLKFSLFFFTEKASYAGVNGWWGEACRAVGPSGPREVSRWLSACCLLSAILGCPWLLWS